MDQLNPNSGPEPDNLLDQRISPPVRHYIEKNYYQKINELSRFEQLQSELTRLTRDSDIVGLFPDHGVIHMRDVARRVPALLDQVHGRLIPKRAADRLDWMKSVGVFLACLHDIGMIDVTEFGRKMHPEFAVHVLFSTSFNHAISLFMADDRGAILSRLKGLQKTTPFFTDTFLAFREILSLAMAHSKSKVPVDLLNDPLRLRQLYIFILTHDLATLNALSPSPAPVSAGDLRLKNGELDRSVLGSYQPDLSTAGFLWLTADHPAVVAFREDVIDTLRVVRAADALRQRGTVLKTSGGYEIFVDQQTGHAVYAIRDGSSRLYLLTLPVVIAAGEANIASSEIDRSGDLRISFAQGRFYGQEALDFAIGAAMTILLDIISDVVLAFKRPSDSNAAPLKQAHQIKILLEEPRRNPNFAYEVARRLSDLRPELSGRIEVVPSLGDATSQELAFYDRGGPHSLDPAGQQQLLVNMMAAGHKVTAINLDEAMTHARLVSLEPNEILIEAGAPPNFVYIPLGSGLTVVPLGGYSSFAVQPWMPLGITGVIRGAARNATIRCEKKVSVIMIPRTVYLRHWHATLTPEELAAYLTRVPGES